MILQNINSSKPVAAIVTQSQFDDEPILLPLTPATQKAWSERARRNSVSQSLKAVARLN